MSKKVLIISTSPRKNGNSETLADAFLKEAIDGGNTVEKISLYDKTIAFCKGCLACQKTKRCVIRDDADMIAQKMLTADVLVFATLIYDYEISERMKTMLDRAINGPEGWIERFPKAHFAGTVFAGGVAGVGEIDGHSALTKAYEMGRAV